MQQLKTAEELCDALMDVIERALDTVEPMEVVRVVGLVAGVLIKEAPDGARKLEATRQALRAMGKHAGINFAIDTPEGARQ